MKTVVFDLFDRSSLPSVIEQLAYFLWIKEEGRRDETREYYDTFDWRLYERSLVLYGNESRLWLRHLGDHKVVHDVGIGEPPVFAGELPESKLKSVLAPLIDVRALMRLARVHVGSTSYRVLNPDAKIVAWLVIEELYASTDLNREDPAISVCVIPVRGYPKYTKRIRRLLRELGLTESEKGDIFFKAVEAAAKRPGDYSGAFEIALSPGMGADEAAKAILRDLRRTMRINEGYIEHDVDTEFLHDYRVSVRRTRALLSQLSSVFPKEVSDRFKADFARIGRLTNQLRDLDVHLLSESAYRNRLPSSMGDDLSPLFDFMREERGEALCMVVDGLNSEEYARAMVDWDAFLRESPSMTSEAASTERPIIDLARKRIFRRYGAVVKGGNEILANTQDELLHALRIEAKKLRYLMEFFASLFPHNQMRKLVGQLKRLQDNLGEFNDLESPAGGAAADRREAPAWRAALQRRADRHGLSG